MPLHPDEPLNPALPRPPRLPPALVETPSPDGTGEGMLDLDDQDQINNQHLEVR